MILNYIEAKDDKDSDLSINNKGVFLVDKNTIQVDQNLLNKYTNNTLHILYKKSPEMVTISKTIQEQYVDLPISLLECLIFGMAYYAHTIGIITADMSKAYGGLTVDNLKKTYESSIQKAMAYQITPQKKRDDNLYESGNFF